MQLVFAGQLAKNPAAPEDIEDVIAASVPEHRIVVSDGASESFDSQAWARLLTEHVDWSREPLQQLLGKVISEYDARHDFGSLSWSKQAAFLRGSFATILVVDDLAEPGSLQILAVGDTIAVLLDGPERILSFPYSNPYQFRQRPELLCSKPAHNEFLYRPRFSALHERVWSLDRLAYPTLLCMTDALGEWALRREKMGCPAWQELIEITDVGQLEKLVLYERDAKAMRTDDTTLVRISLKE